MTVVPGIDWGFGEDLILDHYQAYGCNLLIMLGDAWPLGKLPDLAAQDKVLWIQSLPVDWIGMPKNIINRLKPAHKLVPFSKWGENALRKAGLSNVSKAIWLGLNTDLWKPQPREELQDVMNILGYSRDSFNILIVAANQERKRVRQALEAIATFRKATSANVRLYLHSHVKGERDLRADVDELGLDDIIVYPDPYLMTQGGAPESDMVKVFNCADVVINSCLEGFGFSHIQAQACGVPVICLSEGAGPELVVFGYEVPMQGIEVLPNQMATGGPNPIAIAKALEDLWENRKKSGAPLRSPKAIKFVQDNFSWSKIASQWFEVIDQCMEDRVKWCMQVPDTSALLKEKALKTVELR